MMRRFSDIDRKTAEWWAAQGHTPQAKALVANYHALRSQEIGLKQSFAELEAMAQRVGRHSPLEEFTARQIFLEPAPSVEELSAIVAQLVHQFAAQRAARAQSRFCGLSKSQPFRSLPKGKAPFIPRSRGPPSRATRQPIDLGLRMARAARKIARAV